MSSDHPSSPRYRPSGQTARAWSLYVYLVADRAAQQRILRAIPSLGRPGATALASITFSRRKHQIRSVSL